MENANSRKRILFLAANPKNTIPLRLDEEVREIEAGLRRASNRDNFDLLQKWAVRPRDLRQVMLDVKPNIVHFSGHGSSCGGLILEDAMGEPKLIEPMALAGLFSLFSHDLECVLLNACYSEAQAEAINDHIKYVIGMNDAIGDKASIEFAVGFYDALGGGKSVETAYKFGCNAIQLEGLSDNLVPVLKSVPSVKASRNLELGAPKQWVLVLSATIDEVDKDKAEAIIEHLRQLSQDTSLTIRAIKPGSVKLVIESSAEGFDKINTLIRERKLTQIAGLTIQEISEYDEQFAPKCFVLMSFEQDRREVFEHAIRPAAKAAGFDCYRADHAVAPRAIVRDIIHRIFKDEVLIADISGFNPNVFYELGVAHAVGNKTIIICEETKEKLPFDLNSNRIIFYRKNVDGLEIKLRNRLEKSLRDFPNWSSEPSNPVQELSPVRYTLGAQAELEKTIETLRQEVRYLQDEKRRGELRTLILALSHIEIGHLKGLIGPEPFYYVKRPEFLQELWRLKTLGFIRHKDDTKIGDLPETDDLKQYVELTDLSKQVLEEILRIVMR